MNGGIVVGNHTRRITEGAMMVAIVGLLLFLNRQLAGMIEYAMYWILTFPILIYTAKYGRKAAVVPGLSMLLLSFMIAAPTTIFYLFSCVIIGIVYGGGIRSKWSNGTLLLMTGIFTLISYCITMLVFASLFGYNANDDIEFIKMIMNIMNIDGEANSASMIRSILIVSTAVVSILQTMCIHMLSNLLLQRLHIEVKRMKSILDIKVQKWWGYIIISIWVIFWCQNVIKLNEDLSSIILGLYSITQLFCMAYGTLTIMGLCVIYNKRGLVFLILLGLFIHIVRVGIMMIGLCDMICFIREKTKRGVIHGSFRKF